jgi:4-amino-4-deoxy-L-arabinose transferase-like glycosyltransferase
VLFPALVLIFALWHERWGKAGSVAILLAILCLLIGLWALFLTTLEGNRESPAMYVPLPVLVLAGLWWSRWWVVRRHRF